MKKVEREDGNVDGKLTLDLMPAGDGFPIVLDMDTLEEMLRGAVRDPNPVKISNLNKFFEWARVAEANLLQPDMAAFRDFELERGCKATTVGSRLGTIRHAYRSLMKTPDFQNQLFQMIAASGKANTISDLSALITEMRNRIEWAIDPVNSPVKGAYKRQDVVASDHLWMTKEQSEELLSMPGIDTFMGLRDTVAIGLPLLMGLRKNELRTLEVRDLREYSTDRALGLHVRHGKGHKTRLVFYGKSEWLLKVIDKWLAETGIEEGPVLRGLKRDRKSVRDTMSSVNLLGQILKKYPILVNGERKIVQPHDLRRSYARQQFDAGMKIEALAQQLGHARPETTLIYIGELDSSEREARVEHDFDIEGLEIKKVRRTDKLAAREYLLEDPQRSRRTNKWIAEDLGIHSMQVKRARAELEAEGEIPVIFMLKARDGRYYARNRPMRKASREKIVQFLKQHPEWGNGRIGREVGGAKGETVENVRVGLEGVGEIPVYDTLIDSKGRRIPRRYKSR